MDCAGAGGNSFAALEILTVSSLFVVSAPGFGSVYTSKSRPFRYGCCSGFIASEFPLDLNASECSIGDPESVARYRRPYLFTDTKAGWL